MSQTKTLNIVPDDSLKRIHLSQGDLGRTLIFKLFEGSASYSPPTGATVKIVGTKPSGVGYSVDGTFSGNTVTIVTTSAMTDEYGAVESELIVTNQAETEIFKSANFLLMIEKDPHPAGTVDGESSVVVPTLLQLQSAIGDLTQLNTTDKSSLVDAINEVRVDVAEATKNLIKLKAIDQTSNGVRIVTEQSTGKVTASGQSSGAGYIVITPTLTLPAGTYTISPFPTTANHLYFQVRSTANEYIEQTGVDVTKTFTLAAQKDVVIRATWTATFNETAVSYPQIETGSTSTYFLPSVTAQDDYARYIVNQLDLKAIKYLGTLANGTDLNDANDLGYYTTFYSASYTNDPISGSGHRKLIINFTDSIDASSLSNTFIVQFLINYDSANTIMYYRMRSVGTWTDWRLMYKQTDVETLKSNVASLMSFTSDNTVLTNSDVIIESSPINVGTNLTVLSYNVANYNNDTATYITDAKRTNFKKMLNKINADFIGLQEARQYIDSGNSHDCMNYIYRPIFSNNVLGSGGSILAKMGAPESYDNMKFSNGRNLLYGLFTINSKKLLLITTHPVADQSGTGASSATSISARLTQYTELMKWVNNEIQLTSQDGLRTKYRPNWDWCIICGDFNSITDDDKTNLATLANSYSFSMANGGWLGWVETARNTSGSTVYSLDNILCSSNIIINSINSHKSMYGDLYSDHYPLSVNLTLLDS